MPNMMKLKRNIEAKNFWRNRKKKAKPQKLKFTRFFYLHALGELKVFTETGDNWRQSKILKKEIILSVVAEGTFLQYPYSDPFFF